MSVIADLHDQIRAQMANIQAAPEGLAYIVLDHEHPADQAPAVERDGRGRLYARCSPSVMDGVTPLAKAPPASGMLGRIGTPVYRREDMPKKWPDA